MLYTVEQVSKELNISKQAIYKQLKKEEFKQFIVIEKGIKHIRKEGVNYLKGIDSRDILIKEQSEEIERLRKNNKKLMDLLEQQNQIILNSQDLQKQALTNTEILLLEKKEELKKRNEEFNKRGKLINWFRLRFN
ncbi:DNA-binding protein [Clostridium perfringens]|uniref:DNA-binding protein n=1 Tax=Clostridium perfringens TaxID=1502 RepID=UPI0024BD24B8|nr:DNA-binding protein [Clostridium perfringens]